MYTPRPFFLSVNTISAVIWYQLPYNIIIYPLYIQSLHNFAIYICYFKDTWFVQLTIPTSALSSRFSPSSFAAHAVLLYIIAFCSFMQYKNSLHSQRGTLAYRSLNLAYAHLTLDIDASLAPSPATTTNPKNIYSLQMNIKNMYSVAFSYDVRKTFFIQKCWSRLVRVRENGVRFPVWRK